MTRGWGGAAGKCYLNEEQGQWHDAPEALLPLRSADLNITQQSIYSLHLIHELQDWGTLPACSWQR